MIHKQHCSSSMQSARILQITHYCIYRGYRELSIHVRIATKVSMWALLMVVTTMYVQLIMLSTGGQAVSLGIYHGW